MNLMISTDARPKCTMFTISEKVYDPASFLLSKSFYISIIRGEVKQVHKLLLKDQYSYIVVIAHQTLFKFKPISLGVKFDKF